MGVKSSQKPGALHSRVLPGLAPARQGAQVALPRVTTMTGMLRRWRVACDSRRKPYSSEYSTMYSSCGHTADRERVVSCPTLHVALPPSLPGATNL